jgi:hypothetical protein
MNFNPVAIFFVIFTSAVGHIFGHTDIGMAIGSRLDYIHIEGLNYESD